MLHRPRGVILRALSHTGGVTVALHLGFMETAAWEVNIWLAAATEGIISVVEAAAAAGRQSVQEAAAAMGSYICGRATVAAGVVPCLRTRVP